MEFPPSIFIFRRLGLYGVGQGVLRVFGGLQYVGVVGAMPFWELFLYFILLFRPWSRAGSGIGQERFQKAMTSCWIALSIIRAKGGKVVVPANEFRLVTASNLEAGLSLLGFCVV